MKIESIKLNNENQLMTDYRKHKSISSFFDYLPYDSLSSRVEALKNREFKREDLSLVLARLNKAWGADITTMDAIDKFKDPNSVVVVGGQQAGLGTGPLYTINKIISILQFAKEKEKELEVPVLPVFWIAGEDHDYDEINHLYLPEQEQLVKYKFNQFVDKKAPISEIKLDSSLGEDWIKELLTALPETVHTKEIHSMMKEAVQQSHSITDFFAILIHTLFQGEGLILIDAADESIRDLERDYFVQLIENQPKIAEGVYKTADTIQSLGYGEPLELSISDGHLFYHVAGERILLQRTEDGKWIGKQNEIELTTDELLHCAMNEPNKLSNNVVTRPVMQELLLPTLAFIGGPGEIRYWSLLKPAFQALDIEMPPVIPRLSFTLVTDRVEKALERTGVRLETALVEGCLAEKEAWLQRIQKPPIQSLTDELKETIREAHQPVKETAENIRSDIGALADKNLQLLNKEIDYLGKRMEQGLKEKYDYQLREYDYLEMMLHPDGGLQERMWNVLPFINKYGFDWIHELCNAPCSFQEEHHLVYL
jgi:bacillithiol biosynthesis cysteine-adding enzyme BshC